MKSPYALPTYDVTCRPKNLCCCPAEILSRLCAVAPTLAVRYLLRISTPVTAACATFDAALKDLAILEAFLLPTVTDIQTATCCSKVTVLTHTTDCRGNVDDEASWRLYPEVRLLELNEWKVLLLHICGMPPKTTAACQELVKLHQPDLVVFGHSHKHGVCQHNGVLYVNPGSAGMISRLQGTADRKSPFDQQRAKIKAHASMYASRNMPGVLVSIPIPVSIDSCTLDKMHSEVPMGLWTSLCAAAGPARFKLPRTAAILDLPAKVSCVFSICDTCMHRGIYIACEYSFCCSKPCRHWCSSNTRATFLAVLA